jgi:hypothetical protein
MRGACASCGGTKDHAFRVAEQPIKIRKEKRTKRIYQAKCQECSNIVKQTRPQHELNGPVRAADLLDGTDDPRATAPDLLRRALAALPAAARAPGRAAVRADAGYFAGQLARAAHDAHIGFAIGAKRIAPLRRLLAGPP